MNRSRRDGWTALGCILTASSFLVMGCGDTFGGKSDCKVTHTCPTPSGGDSSGAAAGAGEDENGGKSGIGGSEEGGSAGTAEPPPECERDADCDNADTTDGIERCFSGHCVPGNPPPTIVSVTPEDETEGVEPDGTIVIEVSEPLEEATVTAETVQILDGESPVSGKLEYADTRITFTPDKPLGLLASYVVSVSTDLKDADGAALVEPFESTFRVRDGAWSVVTVKQGELTSFAPRLSLDVDGRALLAWVDGPAYECPVRASFYQRGELVGEVASFTLGRTDYCTAPRAALSPNGNGLVTWHQEGDEGNGAVSVEYRGGAWGAPALRTNRYDTSGPAVGAAIDGTMHYIGPTDGDVRVWSTTNSGRWPASGFALAQGFARSDAQLSVAKNGDAVATWRAQSGKTFQVLAARYSAQTKTWSAAELIPASTATFNGAPQAAFDADSVPVVLWQRQTALMVARYLPDQGKWSQPIAVSGSSEIFPQPQPLEPPAIAFDGTSLVVAFTAFVGAEYRVFASRYDRENETWETPEPISDAATAPAQRMPQLHADGRGNLTVVWAASTVATGSFNLAYQRFDGQAAAWSGPELIAGTTFESPEFNDGDSSFALGGNADGLAAVAFFESKLAGIVTLTDLRLASFY